MAAEGLSMDWYVLRHRDEAEVLPWDHISAGLHKDFLWQDWQDALAEHGLEDCRWTPCYDCGVCTGYGLEHVVASPVRRPAAARAPGQDLSPRARGARASWCSPAGSRWAWGWHERASPSGCATPRRARSAGPAIGTPPASGSGRCAGRAWPSPTPRASRPGPASTSGWPCRRATSPMSSCSTSTWLGAARRRRSSRTGSRRALPVGFSVTAAAVLEGGEPSLQQDVTSLLVADRAARGDIHQGRGRGRGRPRRLYAFPWPVAARATRPSTTCGRASSPCASRPPRKTVRPSCWPISPPNPGRCVPASCWRRASLRWRNRSTSPTGCAAPTSGSNVTAPAGSPSRCRRRPSRMLWERAHEKDTDG